jgi:hypothetical protein
MYPAIKQTTDYIAQEAFKAWSKGESTEAVILKLCKEHNVTDWVTTVRQSLSRVIHENHLNSRLS